MGNNLLYDNFKEYIEVSRNVFDIMAAAYKILCPFEPIVTLGVDSFLKDAVSRFCERDNEIDALYCLKMELFGWNDSQKNACEEETKKNLFCLIRLIDGMCAGKLKFSCPDTYDSYFALNILLLESKKFSVKK